MTSFKIKWNCWLYLALSLQKGHLWNWLWTPSRRSAEDSHWTRQHGDGASVVCGQGGCSSTTTYGFLLTIPYGFKHVQPFFTNWSRQRFYQLVSQLVSQSVSQSAFSRSVSQPAIQLASQGPVVRRWVKFNPGLGETLNVIPSSRNASGFSKLLLKNTSSKLSFVNPKQQPKTIFKEVNSIVS